MLLVCNGLPRSASSYLFQIAQRISSSAGHDRLANETTLPEDLRGRFLAPHLLDPDAMGGYLPAHAVYPVKTHSPRTSAIARLMETRGAVVLYSVRDPRDIVTALLDAGRAARSNGGNPDFAEIERVPDAVRFLQVHADWSADWLDDPATVVFTYDQLAEDPLQSCQRVADAIGVPLQRPWVQDLIETPETASNQFNVGISGRYAEVLTDEEIALVETEFAELLRRLEQLPT